MKKLLHSRSFYIWTVLIIIGLVVGMMVGVGQRSPVERITTTVEMGTVRQLVSVSGIAEAEQSAELAFPLTGIVEKVNVREGDLVEAGTVLVELDRGALLADRQEAIASLAQAVATRDELIAGPTGPARDVTAGTISLKEQTLQTIRQTEAQKVENARRTLLSSGLTAYSNTASEDAVPPVVSGTYTCNEEGQYVLRVYSSSADSGYSYELSGLESGTFVASIEQPAPLGNCGLRILFDNTSTYSRSEWIIEVPNTKSSSYVTNQNAYELAKTQAESAILNAEQDLEQTRRSATNTNAPARSEEVRKADATIAQAQARLARINANISDRVLVAPFSGTITELDVLPGETVTTAPVATLLASAEFEVTARIPEIDIGKLEIGQKVEMIFDARSEELLTGEVSFISLKATEIDGVAYFKANIKMDTVPPWVRSGLNADIDIIINEAVAQLRVPKRFVTKTEAGAEVITLTGEALATTTVEVVLEGNDGYVAITGVNAGTILVAP